MFIVVICFLFTLVLILGTIVGVRIIRSPNITYTTNFEDYFAKEVYNHSNVLPEKIPDNAQIVGFYYYNYWNEDVDVFLEIQFDTKDDLISYVDFYEKLCQEQYQTRHNVLESCFVKKNNAYCQSYTELYHIENHTMTGEKSYVGYEINPAKETLCNFDCHFGVVCYSYEELRVVFSYVRGGFRNRENYYTPAYFIRFKVPTAEKIENYIVLEE